MLFFFRFFGAGFWRWTRRWIFSVDAIAINRRIPPDSAHGKEPSRGAIVRQTFDFHSAGSQSSSEERLVEQESSSKMEPRKGLFSALKSLSICGDTRRTIDRDRLREEQGNRSSQGLAEREEGGGISTISAPARCFRKKKRKDSPAMTKSAPSAALAVFFEARLALAFLASAEPRDPERTSRASSARAAARWDFMTSGFVEVWRRRREKKNVRMEKKVRKLTFFSQGVRILTSSSKARSEQAT